MSEKAQKIDRASFLELNPEAVSVLLDKLATAQHAELEDKKLVVETSKAAKDIQTLWRMPTNHREIPWENIVASWSRVRLCDDSNSIALSIRTI